MAKVPLRKYISEIESLIEHGQTEEAIAHCRHILKTFPKHLETYRLLGKGYLESKRHSEASDIFTRILMAVPDDFVSHVGLSIIADEKKQLENAIWHMERAFEKQPSNAAIQAELQRLYGRRDGREPTKIRLNRGALAHMYYQGELYTQAVGEIRSVLNEDPSRIDLQSLLALCHFRAGQKVEASAACSKLIEDHPYSLDANRALTEILPGTGKADDAAIYRQRVVELDPYAAFTRGSIFQTADVPDEAVLVERLEYRGKPVETRPDWTGSLGSAMGADAAAAPAPQPDWLKQELDSTPVSAFPQDLRQDVEQAFPAEEPEQPVAGTGGPLTESQGGESEEIPNWMRQAGWGESTGTFDESAASITEETGGEVAEELPEGELARADLPDWIKSMAPQDSEPAPAAAELSATVESSDLDQDTMDWLNNLSGDKPFDSTPAAEVPQADIFAETPKEQEPAGVPDWLASLDSPSGDSASTTPAETPNWLSDLGESDGAIAGTAAAASTADWLSKLDEEETPVSEIKAEVAPMPTPKKEIPPAPEPVVPAQPVVDAGMGNLGTTAAEQDAAMLWLESLAARQGAKSEELITKPEDRLEKPPEWVEQFAEQGREASAVQPVSPEPETVEPLPEFVSQVTEEPEPTLEVMPEPVSQDPVKIEPASQLEWSQEAEPVEAAPSEMMEIDRTGIWLSELDEKEPTAEKTPEVEPTDWTGEIEITPGLPTAAGEFAHDEDVPTWLKGADGRPIKPVTSSLGDMPEWLKGEERAEAAIPEPTQPADWMPESEVAAPEPVTQPVQKPEPKPKPRTTSEFKFELKPEPMVEPKSQQKPQPKVELKPEPKVEPKPQAKAQVKPEAKPKPVQKPAAAPKEDLSRVRRNGMIPSLIDPSLASAREAMSRGKIPDALQVYESLIRKGKMLEDITFDLKEALYRFPVEVSIWQTLGDAYMRSNRLQDALDAYTKAEELLR